MELVTTLLIIAPAQVIVFALVPLSWWLNAGRPEGSFLRWLGFRAVRDAASPRVLGMIAICGLGFLGSTLLAGPVLWPPRESGPMALLVVPVIAVLQRALSEEIFFRGYLLRWLQEKRPWPLVANLVQACLCGVVHGVGQWLFAGGDLRASLAALALGTGAALAGGWLRQHTGSILLPWAAHGGANLAGGLILVLWG